VTPGPRLLRLLFTLCWCLWAANAAAEDSTEAAKELFNDGEKAFSEERFEDAARLFEEADKEAPHASVIYNAAVSWDQAGQLTRAADAYMIALARGGLNERDALDAESRLDSLSRQLAFVQIVKPVGGLASVAHKQREPIPTRFYLSPGDYQILLETASGATSETPITAGRGETLRIELSTPAPPADRQPDVTPPPPPPVRPAEPKTDRSTQEVLGWVGVGLGVVATGTALYLGTRVLAEKDTYEDSSQSPQTRNTARESFLSLRTGTNVAWGSAAVLGGVGMALLLTSPTFEF